MYERFILNPPTPPFRGPATLPGAKGAKDRTLGSENAGKPCSTKMRRQRRALGEVGSQPTGFATESNPRLARNESIATILRDNHYVYSSGANEAHRRHGLGIWQGEAADDVV